MDLEQLCQRLKNDEITLDKFVEELKKMRAFSQSDRFKLNAIDNAPFTLWASDKNNIIRYWECQCQVVYGHTAKEAIGQNFLKLFVAEAERSQADIDAKKIIAGEAEAGEFSNNIAVDFDSMGSPKQLMTNCFRVFDESTGEWLQAEIAILTKIEEVRKKYAAIIADYERLKGLIAESKRDKNAFLETFNLRINNLVVIATVINQSKSKFFLDQTEAENIDTFPEKLDILQEETSRLIEEAILSLEKAASIEEYEQLESKYKECKNRCNIKLEVLQYVLADLSEEIKQSAIKKHTEFLNKKATAIQQCDTYAETINRILNQKLQVAFDYLKDPDYEYLSRKIRSKIDLLTEIRSKVTFQLSSVKQAINICSDFAQVELNCTNFKKHIEDINKEINQIGDDVAS